MSTKELIAKLQTKRESKLLVYFVGDRQNLSAQIGEDAVRILYEHLLKINRVKRISLCLYTRGGDVGVPWKIVTMIREFCEEFEVLIPYRAHSAGTLISIGADKIVMGRKGELSPIDPTLTKFEKGVPTQIVSVENINSFIDFIRTKANINDQSALASLVSILANNISPDTLGRIHREDSHIRLVARKMLTTRKEKLEEERIVSIIELLTQKMYSHGHAISRKEAKEIGLPVEFPDDETEKLLWKLYLEYEKYLELNKPLDALSELGNEEEKEIKHTPICIIESEGLRHEYQINVLMKKRRNIPPNPQININLNLQLPPQIKPETLPQEVQQVLQNLFNQMVGNIKKIVEEEIRRQSPEIGVETKTYGGRWVLEYEGE